MSLTISGWVAEQVMWWDDGFEDNVYVGGLGSTLASHFKMTGSAQISPGFSAGYVLHVELIDTDSLTWNQINPIGFNAGVYGSPNGALIPGGTLTALQSYWFLKSDHLGKVSMGRLSSASDNAAILVDGSGSLVPANWVMFDYGGFILRNRNGQLIQNAAGTAQLTWGQIGSSCRGGGGIGGDCFGAPRQAIRYDSPVWHGFSVSTSWGGDDFWDVAARYAGEWGGFKVAATAAYTEFTPDFGGVVTGIFNPNGDSNYFQAGLYVQHIPTGLWAYGAYGRLENEGVTGVTPGTGGVNGLPIGDGRNWYVKAGLRERWHPLGHTVLYGEYAKYKDSESDLDANIGFVGSEVTLWGLGVVQEIDPAAMSLFLSYRHIEGDLGFCRGGAFVCNTQPPGTFDVEDFQYVKFGALINF